jgi:hypothetical protein
MSAKPVGKNSREDVANIENVLPAAHDDDTTIVAIGASAGGIEAPDTSANGCIRYFTAALPS